MPEKGKVKWFSNVKGYGFLQKEDEDGKDIFVHYASILSDGYKTLKGGEEVTFEIVDGDRGPQAKNVVRVAKPPKQMPGEEKAEEAPAAEETPKEEVKEEAPKEEKKEPPKEEAAKEAPVKEEPAEDKKEAEATPAPEAKEEPKKEN